MVHIYAVSVIQPFSVSVSIAVIQHHYITGLNYCTLHASGESVELFAD